MVTRLAVHAMRCRFELVVCAAGYRARAAGEAALREITRLEAMLSPFEPTSEIAAVNANAGRAPVRVSGEVFALLRRCHDLWEWTGGAFDPTVGPLMRLYGFRGDAPLPDTARLADVMTRVGFDKLRLDPARREVLLTVPGMALDLGAVGKGFAIDAAAEALAGTGLGGLLHAGTSTVRAIGDGPDGGGWPIALADPEQPDEPLATVNLSFASLSVSGRQGRVVTQGAAEYSHIVDPRTGQPAEGLRLAAVIASHATESDALSTALLLEGRSLCGRLPMTWSRSIDRTLLVSILPVGVPGGVSVE